MSSFVIISNINYLNWLYYLTRPMQGEGFCTSISPLKATSLCLHELLHQCTLTWWWSILSLQGAMTVRCFTIAAFRSSEGSYRLSLIFLLKKVHRSIQFRALWQRSKVSCRFLVGLHCSCHYGTFLHVDLLKSCDIFSFLSSGWCVLGLCHGRSNHISSLIIL